MHVARWLDPAHVGQEKGDALIEGVIVAGAEMMMGICKSRAESTFDSTFCTPVSPAHRSVQKEAVRRCRREH